MTARRVIPSPAKAVRCAFLTALLLTVCAASGALAPLAAGHNITCERSPRDFAAPHTGNLNIAAHNELPAGPQGFATTWDPFVTPVLRQPRGNVPARVTTTTNVYYIAGDTLARHTLDIYQPQNAKAAPVVVFVPGGAWRQGDKSKYGEMAQTLAGYYGYVVVTVDYRLSNEEDGNAMHPDHVNDVAAACRWVRDNIAGYGGDRARMFLFGQSAGAHLVSLLVTDRTYLTQAGLTLSNPRGVVAMSGAYRLYDLVAFPQNPLGLSARETLMYKAILANAFGSWKRAVLDPASPAVQMKAGRPPFLVITTAADMPGFYADGRHFAARAREVGVSARFRKLVRSDYSDATWQKATQLAAEEPALAEYIGHYAEVVAINPTDRDRPPTTWITAFVSSH